MTLRQMNRLAQLRSRAAEAEGLGQIKAARALYVAYLELERAFTERNVLWCSYDSRNGLNQELPHRGRFVLCQMVTNSEREGPNPIVVGYLQYLAGDGKGPTFITPGTDGAVIAWADCLGDAFRALLWPNLNQPRANLQNGDAG